WGYYVRAFSEYNKKVIGLDFEKKMIETSKEICKGIKNIELIQGDVRNLPFKDNYFDYVVSYGVVEHFDETEKAIDEFYRVLKKKGLLFISVPSAYDLTGRLLR
ncbi:MAG: class I SAM-dependent methyltransferase, partial [Candidatus Woesearchaeota archaeon]